MTPGYQKPWILDALQGSYRHIKRQKKGSAPTKKCITLTQTKFFASYVSFVYISDNYYDTKENNQSIIAIQTFQIKFRIVASCTQTN